VWSEKSGNNCISGQKRNIPKAYSRYAFVGFVQHRDIYNGSIEIKMNKGMSSPTLLLFSFVGPSN
jgi:hypothetical protein